MNKIDRWNRPSGEPVAGRRDTSRARTRSFRIRKSLGLVLLSVSMLVTACTPDEIEQSIEMLNVSFEDGGLEGGLSTAALIGQNAALVIGMRLGSMAP